MSDARRVLFPLALVTVFATAVPGNARAGQATSRRPREHQPTKRPTAALDRAVLDTVLLDLATYAGKDSPLPCRGPGAGKVVFDPRSATYAVDVERVILHYRRELWDRLTPAQLRQAREAAEHLVKRVNGRDLCADYRPSDGRVSLWSKDRQGTSGLYPGRPVRAFPPGYTKDHRFAAVQLVVPWSIHHADGTYLLEQRGGKWAIVLRQFVYYP